MRSKIRDKTMVGWFDGFLFLHRFRAYRGSSLERVDDIFVHHQILKNLLLFF